MLPRQSRDNSQALSLKGGLRTSPLTVLPGLHTLEPSQSPHLVMLLLPWRWQLGGGPQLWVWGECCQHPRRGDTELTRWSLLQGLDPKLSWG